MERHARRSRAEQRWLRLSHVLFAVTLGVPTVITVVDGAPGTRIGTVAIAVVFAGWYTAVYAAHPQWHERAGVMTVYAAGALALFAVLNARQGAYFLLLYSLLPQFFATLPRGLAVLGVAGIVLLPATVRGDLDELLAGGDALFSLLATVGLGLCVTAVIEALGRQTEEQDETIGQLEAARTEIEHLLATARRDLRERDALARAGHALIAARTPRDVVVALAQELADHSTGVRGVALLSTLDGSGDGALVLESVAGTVSPHPGTRVPLPARRAPGEVTVVAADDLAVTWHGHLDARTPAVALLPATTVATADADIPGTAGAIDPVADLLWLSLSTRELSAGMRRDLSTIATQTALALDNLRLAARAAERGRAAGTLEERQRLAHEIHDTLAQGLTSIVTQLEAADQAQHNDPAAAAAHVDRARRTARDSLTEARRTVEALRPRPLEEGSLADALENVAMRWRSTLARDTRITVTVDGAPTTNAPHIDAALLRVAQEALTNVGRHAGAGDVVITLSYLDDLVLLDIQDDGAGFDATNGAGPDDVSTGGYGLVAMRERMAGVGGELVVESTPGDGTTIAARVPLPVMSGQGPDEEVVHG